MSEKALELLAKLGIEAEKVTAEDADIDAIANEFTAKKLELLKHDADFLEPIKEQVGKESSIVAVKKAKKALNEKWGLGLSNKELDEADYSALLDLTYEKSRNSATQEVSTLQEQIIALTNKAKEIEEQADHKVKEVERTWAEKYLSGRRSEVMTKTVGELDLIIGKEKATKLLEMEIRSLGYTIDFTEDGREVIKKGEYEALNADKTGKLTVSQLAQDILSDFIKKSNGAPGGEQKKTVTISDNLPASMRERLAAMEQKFA